MMASAGSLFLVFGGESNRKSYLLTNMVFMSI